MVIRREADSMGERAGRIGEVQDPLNRILFHPLAWRLACRLKPTGVTPNMVSVAGACLVVAAAFAYSQPGWPWTALLGIALHLTWHVLDGADGDLARLTNRSGPKGEIIDGLCDYVSHIILYVTLGFVLQAQIGAIAWLFTFGAGLSRIVQANHYEVQRRQYLAWIHGVAWLRSDAGALDAAGPGARVFARAYLNLASRLAPHASSIDIAFGASRTDGTGLADLQAATRRHSRRVMRESALLSANWRTVTLGCSMLAGSPLYFFLVEAVLLNWVLIRSLRNADQCGRAILSEIAPPPEASTRR